MAKPNPTMKHAPQVKPKLTAEQAAIEDFLNTIPPAVINEGDPTTFVDNTINEVIEPMEGVDLEPVVDSAVVADNLDQLADDVSGVTHVSALESYNRIFHQMTEMSGHPVASIESYPHTKGGRARLVKAIRSHADMIRGCVKASFEEYGDKVGQSIDQSMSDYKQALAALNKIDQNIRVPDGEVVINHKAFWQLFHMNDELMDLRDFTAETDAVKELASYVSDAKESLKKMVSGGASGGLLPDGKFVQLMNNTDVNIKGGRAVFTVQKAPAPDREYTAGDFFWMFVFNFAGIAYRLLKGGSGDEKTKKEQSIKAIHKVIDEMKHLSTVVDAISKDAKEIMKIVDKSGDKKSDLQRVTSPVLELAANTIEHVTTVTHGAKKLFEKMDQAS